MQGQMRATLRIETLKRGRSQRVTGGGKAQVNQEYDIPSPEKD
jgi:hypothetical protein